jgi:hypothetical protein
MASRADRWCTWINTRKRMKTARESYNTVFTPTISIPLSLSLVWLHATYLKLRSEFSIADQRLSFTVVLRLQPESRR